jgi:ABC-type sugar transport system substrate-binding protein
LLGCSSGGPAAPAKGVILLRYNPGSESTEQRERGFLETLAKEYPTLPVLSSDQYSGTTPETSLDKSQQLLNKYRGQVQGVFAVCEPNATGMLEALEQEGLTKEVKFVGFDPSPRMIQALADGKMQGMVLQDPVRMGYEGVKTLVAHLEGKPVEKRISTGEFMATPENMQEPRMHQLLNPEQFSTAAEPKEAKYVIAVIPKGTTHEFWKSVHAGAENAAKELGNVEIQWKGPILENDLEGQINVVQDFITRKVDGICLAPLSSQGLVDAVKQAKAAGIPTVIFDSGLDDESIIVSYVATDNYQGGVLAARRLAEAMGAKPGKPSPVRESAPVGY